MNRSIDVAKEFEEYEKFNDTLLERIANISIFSQGSLNYDDIWKLSEKEMIMIESVISDRIKIMAKAGMF